MGGVLSTEPTNDYELAIKSAKELEWVLEHELGASGKGLHEKVSSLQNELSPKLVKRMRYLATIRNKIVHEKDFDRIPDRSTFIREFRESKDELIAIVQAKRGTASGCSIS